MFVAQCINVVSTNHRNRLNEFLEGNSRRILLCIRNGMAKQYDRRDYAYNFKKSQKQVNTFNLRKKKE